MRIKVRRPEPANSCSVIDLLPLHGCEGMSGCRPTRLIQDCAALGRCWWWRTLSSRFTRNWAGCLVFCRTNKRQPTATTARKRAKFCANSPPIFDSFRRCSSSKASLSAYESVATNGSMKPTISFKIFRGAIAVMISSCPT